MMDLRCDVVVVGAGAAGLSAVCTLVRPGLDVLVLEALDRVGGRTLSRALDHGPTVDRGGQWVAPQQRLVLNLVDEFGLNTYPSHDEGDIRSFFDGRLTQSPNPLPSIHHNCNAATGSVGSANGS